MRIGKQEKNVVYRLPQSYHSSKVGTWFIIFAWPIYDINTQVKVFVPANRSFFFACAILLCDLRVFTHFLTNKKKKHGYVIGSVFIACNIIKNRDQKMRRIASNKNEEERVEKTLFVLQKSWACWATIYY